MHYADKKIKSDGIEYFYDLPLNFQKEHPELFLPENINEELREKFCNGGFSFEDIRRNPELKSILLEKDISVGFGTKKEDYINGTYKQKNVISILEKLPKQEIIDFASEYGKYLEDVDAKIFTDGQSTADRIVAIQEKIEENILNRTSIYNEDVPKFFKQKHPEMFLSELLFKADIVTL